MPRWAVVGLGTVGLGSLLILAGCPGNLENPERFADTGSGATAGTAALDPVDTPRFSCVSTLFSGTGKCGGAVCHTAGPTIGGGLDLSTKGVTSRLLNVSALFKDITGDPVADMCPTGAKYIDSANPMASWMLVKINAMQGTCGSAMPVIGMLTPAEKTCLTDYVTSFGVPGGGGASAGGSGGASAGGGGT